MPSKEIISGLSNPIFKNLAWDLFWFQEYFTTEDKVGFLEDNAAYIKSSN